MLNVVATSLPYPFNLLDPRTKKLFVNGSSGLPCACSLLVSAPFMVLGRR
jgi:hypothetical protein